MCTGPYEIPNVKVNSYTIFTNNLPGGAFRGFGGPQGAFAAETQINKLAEKLNLDVVEIRMRNFNKGRFIFICWIKISCWCKFTGGCTRMCTPFRLEKTRWSMGKVTKNK